jgi:hypothetical protein
MSESTTAQQHVEQAIAILKQEIHERQIALKVLYELLAKFPHGLPAPREPAAGDESQAP